MRVKNKDALASHGNIEGRRIVAELLDAGLDSLDPYFRVKQFIRVENNKIILNNQGFEMKGDPHTGPLEFDLKDYDRVLLIGAAKGMKKVDTAVANNDLAAAQAALPEAVKAIEMAASKGVYHKNNAARKVSRVSKAVNTIA